MTDSGSVNPLRCSRCGREAESQDKFCAECGMFLRDAFIDQRLLLALGFELEGKSRNSRRELERLLELDPDNILANQLLGTLYFHQGTLELAIERYEAAVAAAPDFVLGHYNLGIACYHRGNMPQAIRSFRRCLEIDKHYNAAHYRLALALFHAGSLVEALEHFEEAAALTPEYLMAYYHMGVIYERLNQPDKAAQSFQRAIDEVVGEVSSVYHLARLRQAEGNGEEAEALLERTREFASANNISTAKAPQDS